MPMDLFFFAHVSGNNNKKRKASMISKCPKTPVF